MGYLYLSCKAESAVSTSHYVSSSKEKSSNIKIQEFLYSDLEAATNGFSDRKLLGKGSHGYVYKVVVCSRPVAVKHLLRSQHHHNNVPQRPTSCSFSSTPSEVDNEIYIFLCIHGVAKVVGVEGHGYFNGGGGRGAAVLANGGVSEERELRERTAYNNNLEHWKGMNRDQDVGKAVKRGPMQDASILQFAVITARPRKMQSQGNVFSSSRNANANSAMTLSESIHITS
ncbi:Serine/threonine-protein kinase-like protein [Glycine soja]